MNFSEDKAEHQAAHDLTMEIIRRNLASPQYSSLTSSGRLEKVVQEYSKIYKQILHNLRQE